MKNEWKWLYFRSLGIDVPRQRGWCRMAVSGARRAFGSNSNDYINAMKHVGWGSLI